MKRRDAGRVLTFAVTGALLGGVGLGGCRYRGPYVNPGPDISPPTEPTDPEPTDPEPTDPEPTETVNEGPVEEPTQEPPVVTSTNPGPEPEPELEPPVIEPSTNNVRKVDDAPPHGGGKYVNPIRVAEPEPPPKKK